MIGGTAIPPTKEQREGLQEWCDSFYYPVDGSNHYADTQNHRGVHLWKLYGWGDVACHFHLRVYFAGQSHSHSLCADFQVAVPQGTLPAVGELEIGGACSQGSVIKLNIGGSQQQGVECPVFVLVGKFSKGSEGTPGRVRSIVGLRDVNNCPVSPWDFAEMYPLVGEPVATVLNRELDPLCFSPRLRNPDVVAIELPEQIVEGTSEIMHNIVQGDAHAESPIVWDCCDAKDMLARLRIQLGVELNKVGFGSTSAYDGPDYGLQGIAMLVRPLNLGSALGKVNHHD